jgi:hypothetical protein
MLASIYSVNELGRWSALYLYLSLSDLSKQIGSLSANTCPSIPIV